MAKKKGKKRTNKSLASYHRRMAKKYTKLAKYGPHAKKARAAKKKKGKKKSRR